MRTAKTDKLETLYPATRAAIGPRAWELAAAGRCGWEDFPERLEALAGDLGLPGFVPELARLERALEEAGQTEADLRVEARALNPSARLLKPGWKNLVPLLNRKGGEAPPERGDELVLLWRHPRTGEVRARVPDGEDLLAMKLVVEGVSPEEAASQGGLTPAAVEGVLERAAERGVLLAPESLIRRDPLAYPAAGNIEERFLVAKVFTLQWHITQACDLHCKHCYDRSDRSHMPFDRALRVLEDFRSFCRQRHVRGQVSFSGGNPFLYPRFEELYRAAAELGLDTAILGNPTPREKVERVMEIQKPAFFQVSLEGLRERNDEVRGAGHFDRTMEFLDVLADLGIYSMVMLTLTRDNMEDVIPLGEALRDRVDLFTFNRLSMVGEGAQLGLPSREAFAEFLERHLEAARHNPVMRLKDNLINILRYKRGERPFGGCTGFGCGAAFNFLTLLSDGEVHACRKFPSPIGNVFERGLSEIYDSEQACRYRAGTRACRDCPIRPVCGGCLSISHSFGLDVFEDRDPFCFM